MGATVKHAEIHLLDVKENVNVHAMGQFQKVKPIYLLLPIALLHLNLNLQYYIFKNLNEGKIKGGFCDQSHQSIILTLFQRSHFLFTFTSKISNINHWLFL